MRCSIFLCFAVLVIGQSPDVRGQRTPPTPILREDGNTSSARLYVFLPGNVATSQTAAVVVCPGGGYARLAMEKEGFAVADWLNSIGVAALVLEYRTELMARPPLLEMPLEDAQWAIRTARLGAEGWKINPDRTGILGFSAGGHLAATAGSRISMAPPQDSPAFQNARPDFMILIYPVISMTETLNHGGSRLRLIGENPDQATIEKYSNELRVTEQTPPAFIISGGEDTSVKPENSVRFYRALREMGVPAELHLFEKGRHGFGLAQNTTEPQSQWPALCEAWMRGRGLIP